MLLIEILIDREHMRLNILCSSEDDELGITEGSSVVNYAFFPCLHALLFEAKRVLSIEYTLVAGMPVASTDCGREGKKD